MITAARPMTMAPRPMLMSAKLWYWASRAPDSATSPLERTRPSTLLKSVLIPCARAMLGLAPVARSEEPSSVPKNQYRTATMTTVKVPTTKMGCCQKGRVPLDTSCR